MCYVYPTKKVRNFGFVLPKRNDFNLEYIILFLLLKLSEFIYKDTHLSVKIYFLIFSKIFFKLFNLLLRENELDNSG